jgi:transposase-like protein
MYEPDATRRRAGRDYPASLGEFQSWFTTDADCLDYLEWLRWPDGFICPHCAHQGGWHVSASAIKCPGCRRTTAVTAGTLFDRRRTPLTVWFQACWEFAASKDGVSALSLQQRLSIGSYQTAWSMLHRLRRVLNRPGRDLLAGTVEVDETYIGGQEKGLAGGRAKGKKTLVVVAVEHRVAGGLGRARMQVIDDASAATLRGFITGTVAPGSTVITDGWSGYLSITGDGYVHDRRSQRAVKARGGDIDSLLPGVHRVASLVKRWLLSTHQGGVGPEHLQEYLDEFCFRFNRRRSRSRGLVFLRVMELAVGHEPVRYTDLVAMPGSAQGPVRPPSGRGHPVSLERGPANRPWRRTAESPRQVSPDG